MDVVTIGFLLQRGQGFDYNFKTIVLVLVVVVIVIGGCSSVSTMVVVVIVVVVGVSSFGRRRRFFGQRVLFVWRQWRHESLGRSTTSMSGDIFSGSSG